MSFLKKIFFISAFFLFLALLFWGIYIISFKKATPTDSTQKDISSASINTIKDPAIINAKISPVSEEAVISPTLSPNEENIWYYSMSGEMKETNLIGTTIKNLTEKKIINLLGAVWSPDKSRVLLKSNANNHEYFLLFNTTNENLITLDKNINSVAWLSTSDKIVYKYLDPVSHKSYLNISDPDGRNWKKINNLPHDKFSFFQIPRSGLISFWNNGDAYYSTSFQTISFLGENSKILYKNGFGVDYLWDNYGSHILVSQANAEGGAKIQLGVMNYNGEEFKDLGLPTFVSKCTWSKNGEFIYCALPGEIPENSVLPNDYKAGKFKTSDTFWKIDISTGEKERLVETSDINKAYDASQLFLNSDESILFFVNKADKKLYKINL